jgi:transcriptional regulator with XRE-family HTH domain
MSWGDRLKELRIRKGESLRQVADAVSASKPHIWELEQQKSKNPSLDLLTKLAQHFNVSISYLLDESMSADTMIFGREFKGVTEEDKKLFWQMAEKMLSKDSDGWRTSHEARRPHQI